MFQLSSISSLQNAISLNDVKSVRNVVIIDNNNGDSLNASSHSVSMTVELINISNFKLKYPFLSSYVFGNSIDIHIDVIKHSNILELIEYIKKSDINISVIEFDSLPSKMKCFKDAIILDHYSVSYNKMKYFDHFKTIGIIDQSNDNSLIFVISNKYYSEAGKYISFTNHNIENIAKSYKHELSNISTFKLAYDVFATACKQNTDDKQSLQLLDEYSFKIGNYGFILCHNYSEISEELDLVSMLVLFFAKIDESKFEKFIHNFDLYDKYFSN